MLLIVSINKIYFIKKKSAVVNFVNMIAVVVVIVVAVAVLIDTPNKEIFLTTKQQNN